MQNIIDIIVFKVKYRYSLPYLFPLMNCLYALVYLYFKLSTNREYLYEVAFITLGVLVVTLLSLSQRLFVLKMVL